MDRIDRQASIEAGESHLGRWDKFNHYFPVYLLFGISVSMPGFWLYDQVIGLPKPPVIHPGDLAFSLIVVLPLIVGIVIYRSQKRALRLVSVKTGREKSENRELVRKAARTLGCDFAVDDEDEFVGITNPPFRSGSWGERITVLFESDEVFVNSICDPDKQTSLVSCGRNRANVRKIVRSLNAGR